VRVDVIGEAALVLGREALNSRPHADAPSHHATLDSTALCPSCISGMREERSDDAPISTRDCVLDGDAARADVQRDRRRDACCTKR